MDGREIDAARQSSGPQVGEAVQPETQRQEARRLLTPPAAGGLRGHRRGVQCGQEALHLVLILMHWWICLLVVRNEGRGVG